MAIPSSGYDIATISNPSSALTDFSLIVDLSNMSTDWWSAVDINNGTYGRASKADGTTELACDWIDFDSTAETGLLRVKWSGTLASSGTQQIRIYPPQTANGSYSASDTYGQYNAYDSGWVYYGEFTSLTSADRTENQTTVTDNSVGYNATTGINLTNSSNLILTNHGLTNQYSFYADGISGDIGAYDSLFIDSDDSDRFYLRPTDALRFYSGGSYASLTNFYWGTWSAYGISVDSSGDYNINADGSVNYSGSLSTPTLTNESIIFADAMISLYMTRVHFHNDVKSNDWLNTEHAQTSDNATFWGTWTWVSGGGGTVYELDMDTGTFAVSGSDIALLKHSLIAFETGVFTVTGEDVSLLKDSVLNFEQGTFTFTGRSIALIYSGDVSISGGSPLAYRRNAYTEEQKKLYYANQVLWGT